MRKPTVKSLIKRFCIIWRTGVEARYKAACVYAEAVNEFDLSAKQAFRELEEFSNWTPMKWSLLYHIGCGNIPKCYLDFNRPSIPLAMRRIGITPDEQERIFMEGVFAADINGKVRCIKLRHLQEKILTQVWDENGHKRSILQQLKWLQDHQKSNFDVLPDGTIHVHHRCYISPALLVKLLRTKPYPLSAADLRTVADAVRR